MASSEKSTPQPKVFINFREDALSRQFVGHLVADLKSRLCIDVEKRGGDRAEIIQRIKESRIALVIFSSTYTESSWCLNELVEITQRVGEGKLVAIPILYKLETSVIKGLEGDFGLNLWNHVKRTSEFDKLKIWKEALDFISHKLTLVLSENSDEAEFITGIVKEVETQLTRISTDQLSEQHKYVFTEACFSSPEELKTLDSETEFCGSSRNDDNLLDEANSDASPKLQKIVESKRVEFVKEEEKFVQVGQSSTMATYNKHIPQYQVFINFHGEDVRFNFVSHLVSALVKKGVNVLVDEDERRDEDIGEVFKKIEESRIALVVFSSRYSESTWCLDELAKIKECKDESKLEVIPISFKVDPSQVQQLNGDFGDKLWNLWRLHRDHNIIKWKEALESIASLEAMKRLWLKENDSESVFVTSIVEEIYKALTKNSVQEGQNPETTGLPLGRGEKLESFPNKDRLFGIEKRMEQLEQKLDFDSNETRIIGVVGMPGIGKTTLAMMVHAEWNCKFVRCVPLLEVRKKSKEYGPLWLRTTLLKVLLGGDIPIINDETTHESVKNELLQTKVLVILDDVSDKKQFEFLLGDLEWVKKGSKIVITTCDKSLLEGLAHDTYLVPQMNIREAFQLFSYYALDGDQICSSPGELLNRSRISMNYSGGNPLALKLIGSKVRGKDKSHSEHKLQTLCSNTNILDVWKSYIDQLNEKQKDVFLDIVSFFKSEDEYFVRSILDSGDPDSTDAISEVKDLRDKFLIEISDGRVEMNDLVYTFGEHLGSPGRHKLWKYKDIINKLKRQEKIDTNDVRGIFLNMSELTKSISLERKTFTNMRNLRYLKIYDSCCPRQCEVACKLNFPYGFKFALKEVRYLHWEKFPLDELPSEFKTDNLVDLRLPYSKIKRVWEGIKDTPRLKWVDLSHSRKLLDLSGLSKAENLRRLNLEGCTILDELPLEIQNMKSLVFLNLRGCVRLWSLPKVNLISLKILILSDCSNLKEFQIISRSIEFLHLDGTAIKEVPTNIENLQRLILLNLKNCKSLKCLPESLSKLKDLEELILSGCSSLENIPGIKDSMKHLQILRIDGTGAKDMPTISSLQTSYNGVSLLQRLCLSGNNFVSLQNDISKLYNLKWLEVKQCKNLISLPMLPPRLQYFDAHGCSSLESVSNPLALQVLTEHIHATFNFSNCKRLDLDAKDSIITYTQWKSQLVLDAFSRYNGCFALEVLIGTCFPGRTVPAWFGYQASGSVLKPKLPPHWRDNKFIGINLCAVISFSGNHDHMNHLLVRCNCDFTNEDNSSTCVSFIVGGWSEAGNTPKKIESSHVFVGYISRTDINKHGVGNNEEGCIFTEASLEFQVTDGTKEVVGCEVLKCGFSLVYPSDEKTVIIPKKAKMHPFVGVEPRLKQLEKVLYSTPSKTRIIGLVGKGGIGKTTIATILFHKRGCKFPSNLFLRISKEHRLERLRRTLLEDLLKDVNQTISDEITHEDVKDKLLQAKSFIVLDGVSDKKQLEFLLGNLDWIKKGSKILITTRDLSFLEGFTHDTYEVPKLNNKEAFQLFCYNAFNGQICNPTETFLTMSRIFVDNTGGNPLALKLLGSELREKEKVHWEHVMQTMTEKSNPKIQDVIKSSIDQLNQQHKEIFLDIVCFFKSEDEYFVRSLLDSKKFDSSDDISEVRDLGDRLLIEISNGRVEMTEEVYKFGKNLGSPGRYKLLNYEDITSKLKNMGKEEAGNVRGIFIDMFEVTKMIALECMTFTNMHNLRYLKIYDSCYPCHCKADCKLYFPEGLRLPLEEVRYLHWLKFPLQELPSDFKPENLVDLRLPYSKIKCLWEDIKETPLLKSVDLSHSSKLLNISALSKAENLQKLNLEGCTSLDKLPIEIEIMKSLVFLNLRGCVRLWFLPEINLISLKTLILTDCSRLKKFQSISENLEFLHLDGTAVKELPPTIKNLRKLVLLNMRNCKMLEFLPSCLCKLKLLEELILSGCSKLKNFPYFKQSMKHLQILLFDGTAAKEMPQISCFTRSEDQASADMLLKPCGSFCSLPHDVNGVSLLQRLCLSGSDFVSLQKNIGQLYHLKWLDVKHCKKLRFAPMLPPRLQYFDAHGCDSLEKVENPLAVLVVTEHIHATFNFSNCNKLDEDAKDSIISYTRLRSQLMLDELSYYNEGSILEAFTGTCFPGWEVPAWFSHRAFGSVLKPKLPPHWSDNLFIGIAMCAVISFPGNHEQRNRLLVKCSCMFNNKDGSHTRFSCNIGSWSEPSNIPGKSDPSHVFIGYASGLDIKKQGEEEDEEGCRYTEASLEFQVTDGMEVLEGCEVLKCGFSLVYAANELQGKYGVRGAPFRFHQDNKYVDSSSSSSPSSDTPSSSCVAVTPLSNNCTHQVFPSFHGPDVRAILSYVFKSFKSKGIEPFIDNDIKRSKSIGPELIEAIRGSRIAIILLSRNYASSSWCLNELAEIMKCREELGQIVMTIFYEVDPTDVMKQAGDFGKVFRKTCKHKTKEDIERWRHALAEVAQIVGYHSSNWDNEADMIEKITSDISNKLNNSVELHEKITSDISSKLNKSNKREGRLGGALTQTGWFGPGIRIIITPQDQRLLRAHGIEHIYNVHFPEFDEALQKISSIPAFDRLEYLPQKLRLLEWTFSPMRCLPSKFQTDFLVELDMPYTKLEKLWEGIQNLRNLKWMNLRGSENLKELPDLSTASNLKILDLSNCSSLVELPSSIGNAVNIQNLDLGGCSSLVELPSSIGNAVNLEILNLGGCSSLVELPSSIGNAINLKNLDLSNCSSLVKLPSSIGNAVNLEMLDLTNCSSLVELTSSIGNAANLQILNLGGCSSLFELPSSIGNAANLQILNLSGCSSLFELPSSIGNAANLQILNLGGCSSLFELPSSIGNAANLKKLYLNGCSSLVELPSSIGNATNLQILNLGGCSSLFKLPFSIGNAVNLKKLYLNGCSSLVELPSSIKNAVNIQNLDLGGCSSLVDLPSSIGNAINLEILNLRGCSNLMELPSSIGNAVNLKNLDLSNCSSLFKLPSSIGNAVNLEILNLGGCSSLVELPSSIGNAVNLEILNLGGCSSLVKLPS